MRSPEKIVGSIMKAFRNGAARVTAVSCIFILCAGASHVSAQTTQTSSKPTEKSGSTQAHTSTHPMRKRRAKARIVKQAVPVVAIPQPPPTPPPPDWPALSEPIPATVHWDGKQLSVTASNSSLKQVIASVSAATQIPITGLQSDQRIFGEYGPGTPRQVLTELLEGSGYDLLMVGGTDPGIPQRVVLTARTGGAMQPERPAYSSASNTSAAVDPALAQQQLAPAAAPPPSFNRPPAPGMTPQEFIQQRMQMTQQQQSAQQPH